MTLATSAPSFDIEALYRWFEALPPDQRELVLEHPAIKYRLGATCQLTARQLEADALLDSAATHVMLWGGSRSGKTYLLVRKTVARALRARRQPSSDRPAPVQSRAAVDLARHASQSDGDVIPWRGGQAGQSLMVLGTTERLAAVVRRPRRKERTEKVLGNEYATILLNECELIRLSEASRPVVRYGTH
jgi:hypothetical protein